MEEILLILTLLSAKNFQGTNRNQQYQAKFLGVLRERNMFYLRLALQHCQQQLWNLHFCVTFIILSNSVSKAPL